MAKFCIPKELTDKFVKAIRSGKIDPDTISKMTPEERTTFLKDHFGELAKDINQSMEMDLLKKKDSFITDDEVKNLTDMAKKIQDAKETITDDMPNGSPERLKYGAERALFQEYVGSLKESGKNFDYYKNNETEVLREVVNAAKSLTTSLDLSYPLRQGYKAFSSLKYSGIWLDNTLKMFKTAAKELRGTDTKIAVKADILSRKNALNGKYKAGEYDLGITSEEARPSALPEKIPLLGRLYKASDAAYDNTSMLVRADIADKVIAAAEKNGINTLDPYQASSLGNMVNSLTGRGKVTSFSTEGLRDLNAVFFSPRFLKSNFDALTAHGTLSLKTVSDVAQGKGAFADRPDISGYARKEAAKNIAGTVATTAAILYTAQQLWPDSVEWDPRSANFGKIKIGNTRFDVTGGMGSIVTLASRILTFSTKSSTSGRVSKLSTGEFNARTVVDVIDDFWQGKLAPVAGYVRDYFKGEGFDHKKFNAGKEALNLLKPMSVQNFQEMMADPDSAPIVAGLILDGLGSGANTY